MKSFFQELLVDYEIYKARRALRRQAKELVLSNIHADLNGNFSHCVFCRTNNQPPIN